MSEPNPPAPLLAIERLEQKLTEAKRLGLRIRKEWLGGATGGYCQINQRDWLFLDLSLSVFDQLDQVERALTSAAAQRSLATTKSIR